MAYALGQIIGQIVGGAVGALIGALILQYATKWVAKYKPKYGIAYLSAFLGYTASVIVGFVIGFMVGAYGGEFSGGAFVLTMIAGFFVQAAIYSLLIKSPDNEPLGYGKACMVSLLQLIIGGLLLGAIVFIIAAVGA